MSDKQDSNEETPESKSDDKPESSNEEKKCDQSEKEPETEGGKIARALFGGDEEEPKYVAVDRDYPETPEVLGSYVRDKITKFEGIAVSYTQFLTGCNRIGVQPKVSVLDRRVPDAYTFDESHVEVLAASKLAEDASEDTDKKEHDRGGPPAIAPRM